MSSRSGSRAAVNGDEEQPLLRTQQPKAVHSWWSRRMLVDVDRHRADVVLILCYVITGLLDSASISIWGSFVSMQTGNTVYIGIGIAAPYVSTRWIKSATSLASFCLGSFVFARFHRLFSPSPKRRWVLCASFALQTVLISAAASVVAFGPPSTSDEIAWHVLLPISLVAFQSCGQAVTSRALRYNSLTSVVLTSIYCDLFSDAELFALSNVERNRRVAAPAFLLCGAILGGLFSQSKLSIAGALWTAAALKLLATLAWFFWPADLDEDEAEE